MRGHLKGKSRFPEEKFGGQRWGKNLDYVSTRVNVAATSERNRRNTVSKIACNEDIENRFRPIFQFASPRFYQETTFIDV